MKNLQNFGVQELSVKEIRETDGGILPFLIYGAALLVEVACYSAAGDLILNFDYYSDRLEKAMNCE
ncbi:hypothetical protein [Polaribacter sp. Z022]|uniref:hypothetical protein n=1 Tax=Polaribacter sp. Z022 TaxID=2927125 RepID=UPI00202103D5|nr:hypothetical protein [Polaribacter sp. Z022]MCL7752474.1 hypothetical protein [Polaribacter sp. Z022]